MQRPEPVTDADWRERILDSAKQCVLKDRNSTYGAPEDNFACIATMWNAYIQIRPVGAIAPLGPLDVAHMMSLMKLARLAYNPTHVDSFVDFAGYVACASGIALAPRPKNTPEQANVPAAEDPLSAIVPDNEYRGLFFVANSKPRPTVWEKRVSHKATADLLFSMDKHQHEGSLAGLLGFIETSAKQYKPDKTFTAVGAHFRSVVRQDKVVARDAESYGRIHNACLDHNVTIFVLE
jgi:hypothetical protein